MSLAKKILASKKPFVFFHTHHVSKNLLRQAIEQRKSMDLDVSVNEAGNPYLGHSQEYHQKKGTPWKDSMPIWEAVEMISQSVIPVTVDYKSFGAWPVIEKIVTAIGPDRCLVNVFTSEFKFDYSRKGGEPDIIPEWSRIETLRSLKERHPSITTMASAKWLPNDFLLSDQYKALRQNIIRTLKENHVDAISLNIPSKTVSTASLRYFLEENIIPNVEIDTIDATKLSGVYFGLTDYLESASKSDFF